MLLAVVNNIAWAYEVHVFPQLHYVEGAKITTDVAMSQFEILKELGNHRNSAIFSEGLFENLSISSLDPDFVLEAKTMFLGGIPSTFSKLSEEQVNFLGRHRSAMIALAIGLIDGVYKVITKTQNRENSIRVRAFRDVDKEKYGFGFQWMIDNISDFRQLVVDDRDKYARDQISDFVLSPKYHGQPIVLIFGKAHDFRKYSDEKVTFSNFDFQNGVNRCFIFYAR